MFKEIENELLSIISDDPIEKIAHMPTKEIAKTMDLIYNIKFDDISRVYHYKRNNMDTLVVIYDSKDTPTIDEDLCMINGKVYNLVFFPSHVLSKNETNAIILSQAVVAYVSLRVSVIMNEYDSIINRVTDNILYLTLLQATPIITCAIMRKIYSGPTLPKVIYMALTALAPKYKTLYTEEGIETILDMFDEGLGVDELLDNSFICSIKADDKKYPGIWCNNKEE